MKGGKTFWHKTAKLSGKGHCDNCSFVSLNACDKALKCTYPAGSSSFKPVVELVSSPGSEHLNKLLNQHIGQVDFWVKLQEPGECFSFVSFQFFRLTKEEKGRLSCKHRSSFLSRCVL
jgi:hypothetical protein